MAEALKEELLSSLRSELCSSAVLESLRELRAEVSSALAAVRGRLDEDLHRLLGEMEQVKAELHAHKDPAPDDRAGLGGLQDDLRALQVASLAGFAPLQEGLAAFGGASQTDLATLAKQVQTLTIAVGQLPAEIHLSTVDVHPILDKMDEASAQMDLSPVLAEIRRNQATVEVELRAIRENTSQMDTAAIATEIQNVRGELQAAIPRLAAEVQASKIDLALVLAELRAVRDSPARLDCKSNHLVKESLAGELNLSIDLTRSDDVLSGVGVSTIQTPGSSFAFVDLQSSRILSDSVLCPAASECCETDDLAEEGSISGGVQCSQLEKALWELR